MIELAAIIVILLLLARAVVRAQPRAAYGFVSLVSLNSSNAPVGARIDIG